MNEVAGADGIASPEDVGQESDEEVTVEPTEPEDKLVTPSVPKDPALRRGEAEASEEEQGTMQAV